MSERDVFEAKLDITDELLVAYIDDELHAAQRAMVNATLERDAALRRRAEEMRLSRELLREAFPLQSPETVPVRLDAAAERLAAVCTRQFRSARHPFSLRPKYAVAAAVAVFAVAAVAYFAWQPVKRTPQKVTQLAQIEPGNPLHTLLESTPSAQLVEVPEDGATLIAILTFRANDGRFCREFEILASARSSTGIACREKGQWLTEVRSSTVAALASSNYYTPAAGSDDPAIAAVVDKLMQGEPLGVEEEAQVLAAHWPTGRRGSP
jgi:hypothetical protein